jgi:hypothetical protein
MTGWTKFALFLLRESKRAKVRDRTTSRRGIRTTVSQQSDSPGQYVRPGRQRQRNESRGSHIDAQLNLSRVGRSIGMAWAA